MACLTTAISLTPEQRHRWAVAEQEAARAHADNLAARALAPPGAMRTLFNSHAFETHNRLCEVMDDLGVLGEDDTVELLEPSTLPSLASLKRRYNALRRRREARRLRATSAALQRHREASTEDHGPIGNTRVGKQLTFLSQQARAHRASALCAGRPATPCLRRALARQRGAGRPAARRRRTTSRDDGDSSGEGEPACHTHRARLAKSSSAEATA